MEDAVVPWPVNLTQAARIGLSTPGGAFLTADGQTANRLAAWDGKSRSPHSGLSGAGVSVTGVDVGNPRGQGFAGSSMVPRQLAAPQRQR